MEQGGNAGAEILKAQSLRTLGAGEGKHLEKNTWYLNLFYFIFLPKWDLFSSPINCFNEGSIPFFPKSCNFRLSTLQREMEEKRANINHKPEFSHHHFSIWSHQALSEKLPWDFLLFLAFLTEGRAFVFAFLKWNPLMWLSKIQHFHLGKYNNIFHRMTTKLQPPNPKIYS